MLKILHVYFRNMIIWGKSITRGYIINTEIRG